MSDTDNDKLRFGVTQLLSNDTSDNILLKSLSHITPSKRRSQFLLLFLLTSCLVYSTYFYNGGKAQEISIIIIDNVDKLALPILGVSITGYSIFQALVNGNTLITLLKVRDEEYSKFQEYNLFFLAFSMMYLVLVIFNFFAEIILFMIPIGFSLKFFSIEVNNILCGIGLSLYTTIVLHTLIEIKSFIYNLYGVFSTNAAFQGIEFLKGNKEDKKK